MSCPLLDKLSLELRHHIYRYVIVEDEPISVPNTDVRKHMALFATCQQIRDEISVSGIFWENDLRVTCGNGEGERAAGWLAHRVRTDTPGAKKSMFKRIVVEFDMSERMEEVLKDVHRLHMAGADPELQADPVWQASAGWRNKTFVSIVGHFASESLRPALALSSAIKAGTISADRVVVRHPDVHVSQTTPPRSCGQFGWDNALMFMYGFFAGLAEEKEDAMTREVVEGDKTVMMDRFMKRAWYGKMMGWPEEGDDDDEEGSD